MVLLVWLNPESGILFGCLKLKSDGTLRDCMASYHFIGGDGKKYGPYTVDQMRRFLGENRLSLGSQVSIDGGPMKSAADFSELSTPPSLGPLPLAYDPNGNPGKFQAIAYMTLGGGIFSVLWCLFWIAYSFLFGLAAFGLTCLCIPLYLYGFVAGIICILHGLKLNGASPGKHYRKTKNTAIMQIICIIGCDPVNLTLGILNLVFMKNPDVRTYVQSKGGILD